MTLETSEVSVVTTTVVEHKWRFVQGKFKNARGRSLYYCAYFPQRHTPLRGVVLFLHGLGEYARRFAHVFDALCASGIGVIAYDFISHGRSDDDEDGYRAHAPHFQHFVDDTNTFLTLVQQSVYPQMLNNYDDKSQPPPLVLMGMSYGSLVGLHTVLAEQHTFAAVVLAAPAISVEWTRVLRVQRAVLMPFAQLMPRARLTPGVNDAFLSRDPAFVAD